MAALFGVAALAVPTGALDAQWDCTDVSFCFGEACAECRVQLIGYVCEFVAESAGCCCRFLYFGMREICLDWGSCEYVR